MCISAYSPPSDLFLFYDCIGLDDSNSVISYFISSFWNLHTHFFGFLWIILHHTVKITILAQLLKTQVFLRLSLMWFIDVISRKTKQNAIFIPIFLVGILWSILVHFLHTQQLSSEVKWLYSRMHSEDHQYHEALGLHIYQTGMLLTNQLQCS